MSLQASILGLSFGYVLLGLLLLLAVVRTRLPWPVKAGAVAVTSAFYVLVFFRTQGLLGWSADDPLPPNFQLLWVRSVEPNIAQGEPGAIHMWVEALDDDNLPSGAPRAYRRPYSTALARKAERARTEIAAGHPQGGRAAQFGSGEGELSSFRGVRRRRSRQSANPESRNVWRERDSHAGIPGSRAASASRPGMTVWGGKTAPKHFFLSSVDNIPIRFIFPSVLPHREGRSRSSRSRGGMRWTPEMRRHAVHGGTSVFGQDGSAPALPLARRRPTLRWKDPWTV
jgi:hypothetical protein